MIGVTFGKIARCDWLPTVVHALLDGPAILKVQTNERCLERKTKIVKQKRITKTTNVNILKG